MEISKNCLICDSIFIIPNWRKDTAKYCSKECQHHSLKAKPNTICTQCNKEFHKKEYRKNKSKIGDFCSNSCLYEFKKEYFKGENNHQYGLKGDKNSSFKGYEIEDVNNNLVDIKVYKPDHIFADNRGRVLKHRLIVEESHHLFNSKYFIEVDGKQYLKKGVDVHHKDGDHNNNDISNLEPLTRSEHTKLHNLLNKRERDKKGRFKKSNKIMQYNELEEKVIQWAKDKGILEKATPLTQIEKTQEELDETREALFWDSKYVLQYENKKGKLVNTKEEVADGYGDQLVTLIIGAHMNGLNLVDCLESAYNVISKRTGKMVDGVFVKDKD